MNPIFVRSFVRPSSLGLLLSLVAFAACGGDKEVGADVLKSIKPGTPREEVLSIMGKGTMIGTGGDSVRVINGRRHSKFYSNGRNIEVIYYRDRDGNVTDLIEQNQETPVILLENKAIGWGWKFYVESMKTYNLPSPIYEKPAKPALPGIPAGSAVVPTDSAKSSKPATDTTKAMKK